MLFTISESAAAPIQSSITNAGDRGAKRLQLQLLDGKASLMKGSHKRVRVSLSYSDKRDNIIYRQHNFQRPTGTHKSKVLYITFIQTLTVSVV